MDFIVACALCCVCMDGGREGGREGDVPAGGIGDGGSSGEGEGGDEGRICELYVCMYVCE